MYPIGRPVRATITLYLVLLQLLVLKYVQNKDVFMRYHKTHLTRRLILETSADSEMEENMVEWLREVGMPADYVNKLSRMFQDMKVSEDLNSTFKESRRKEKEIANTTYAGLYVAIPMYAYNCVRTVCVCLFVYVCLCVCLVSVCL